MNLIHELRNDILDSKTSLSSVLRRAKVLAYMLKNEEFKTWLDREMNGYSAAESVVPGYRRSIAINVGDFSGPFQSAMRSVPISTMHLDPRIHDVAKELLIVQGVRALESLVESGSHSLRLPWPGDMIAIVADKLFEGYTCVAAWKLVPKSAILQVLEAVRNRLLTFVLELQEKNPQILESDEAIPRIPKEQVAVAFNTYVVGDNNIIAAGQHIDQHVVQQVRKNDLESLLKYMETMGVGPNEITELKAAIQSDPAGPGARKFGSKVTEWIGKMMAKVVEGTWKVALEAAPIIITKALSMYYGWS